MKEESRERTKLINRVKRIRGQMDSVERVLADSDRECAEVLMLLAAVRGGMPLVPRSLDMPFIVIDMAPPPCARAMPISAGAESSAAEAMRSTRRRSGCIRWSSDWGVPSVASLEIVWF